MRVRYRPRDGIFSLSICVVLITLQKKCCSNLLWRCSPREKSKPVINQQFLDPEWCLGPPPPHSCPSFRPGVSLGTLYCGMRHVYTAIFLQVFLLGPGEQSGYNVPQKTRLSRIVIWPGTENEIEWCLFQFLWLVTPIKNFFCIIVSYSQAPLLSPVHRLSRLYMEKRDKSNVSFEVHLLQTAS